MPGCKLREDAVRLQRRIARRFEREVASFLGAPGPELRRYEREHHLSIGHPRKSLSWDTFIRRLRTADIIYIGDYHTLRGSQKTTARILAELAASDRPVILATEVVHFYHQRHLDEYIAGRIPEEEFLARIHYEETWGFPWENHRIVFDLAREHGLRVAGINSDPPSAGLSLRIRDTLAAMVIAEEALRSPEARILAIDGDLHVSRPHLPSLVSCRLEDRGARRRFAIVHQNIDEIYWNLRQRRSFHRGAIVELSRNEFCVVHSSPITKLQSYLNWQLGHEEIGDGTDLTEEVRSIIRTIANFLGVHSGHLDDFTLCTSDQIDLVEGIAYRQGLNRDEIAEVRRAIASGESFFVPGANVIYLANRAVHHAAEEATHYIHAKLSGNRFRPISSRADFYARAVTEALGFLGSRIIDPGRPCPDPDEVITDESQGTSVTTHRRRSEEGSIVAIARLVRRHLRNEEETQTQHRAPPIRRIHLGPLHVRIGAAHWLGYILGDRLYRALIQGKISRSGLADLYRLPLWNGVDPEATYSDLVRRTATLKR